MYRPEGWENCWEIVDEKSPPKYINDLLITVYEAGADAMLEGLKKLPCMVKKDGKDYLVDPAFDTEQWASGYIVFIPKDAVQHKPDLAGADAMGVKTACLVLNIMFYKVPSIAGDESGEWWESELRDKNIPIKWDNELGEFIPKVKDAIQ